MNPKVLILDEPTAGLDPKGRDEILGEIDRLHKEKKMTIILVSHSVSFLFFKYFKILSFASSIVVTSLFTENPLSERACRASVI